MVRLFTVIVSALLALCAGNALGQAAYVHNLNGNVTATLDGNQRTLKVGDLISTGTVVSTGDRSNAIIKFEDGQVMVLAERSSFRIVDYRYNKQRVADSTAVFNLLRGGLRFITGMIGSTNHNNFRLTAGAATIGIRGTSAIINFDERAQAVILAVYAGSLEMVTKEGAVVINSGFVSTYTPGMPPTTPQPTSQASSTVTDTLNSLVQIQGLPINMPVALTASAAAAAAVAQARLLAAQSAANPGDSALRQAAQEAAKLAEAAVLKAIQAAQLAYDEAINGGGIPPDPDTLAAPSGATGYQIEQLITPGGTPCSVASCN